MGPISMTGVRDLFSDLQPVTENKSTLSLSAGRCGAAAPQKGSAETEGSDAGEGFPRIQPTEIGTRRSHCPGARLELLKPAAIRQI
jgi:hypothetical protein